ncbi:MAG TPA: uroporphyrinogen decarboxylase family protein [Armatimonadota bacterium]|jgi:uroporphyrinogen decarboxylase
MTSQERVALALAHQPADRVPIWDGPWGTTLERWRREGMPADVSAADYFGYDLAGTGFNGSLMFPPETVEETEEYTLTRGGDGQTFKNWKHATSTPEYHEFFIKTRADWEEHKHRLAWSDARLDWEQINRDRESAAEHGRWYYFSAAFGYDRLQGMVGSENLLMAMAMEPEWVLEMFDTVSQLVCTALEEMVAGGVQFDGCFLFDDLGYRNATLFSPAMFERYEFHNHKRVYDCARAHGLPCILHSCGQMEAFIPRLIDAGLTCLQALEVKAGMDLVHLKQTYGDRLAFMGGIDARKMAHPDPAVIEEEIRTKVTIAKQGGGYLFQSDHSIPDNVSFEQYKWVIELAHKYGSYE